MSAASFFIDMRRLHLDLRMPLLQSVLYQISVCYNNVVQRQSFSSLSYREGFNYSSLGIQSCRGTSLSLERCAVRKYYSALNLVGCVQAWLVCSATGRSSPRLFFLLTVQCAEVRRGVSGWIHVLRPLNGCSVWVPENYWVVTARN